MPRRALSAFFERVVVAMLPLAAPACGNHNHPTVAADMSTSGSTLVDLGPLAAPDDCEASHPAVVYPVSTAQLPDGGMTGLCRTGAVCANFCVNGYTLCCGPDPADAGALIVTCTFNCGPTGRRPSGLSPATATEGRAVDGAAAVAVGRYLASAAHLEAASVRAFRSLAAQLRRHAAPPRLVTRALAAARDEIRHARLTRALAERHGATPPPVIVESRALPSLETVATENAVEGCVRETFGALLAAWQARAAADPEIRAVMAQIAVDEAAHAELAWDLHDWLTTRLDGAARDRVAAARAHAVAALSSEIDRPLPRSLIETLGLPAPAPARELYAAVRARLWS